jgi:hypothetical protein
MMCHISFFFHFFLSNLPHCNNGKFASSYYINFFLCLLNCKSNELKFKLQMQNVLWCMVSLLLCIFFLMYIIGCLCNLLYDKGYLKTYHVRFSKQVMLNAIQGLFILNIGYKHMQILPFLDI